ncbi:DUF3344 domain-containing protein [Methanobrevibacter sp.]|uniref:DUF3344 domain-containing protein n=1 Tax=Methanobrevibacter sp. TaxID=66852 RepID=UPI00388CFC21
MKFRNNIIFLTIFIFLVIISSGIVFAEDSAMPLVDNGEVSGGVEISSVNPFTSTNGELVYEIPENVTEIKSVNVVVSSYSGSGAPTYGLTTNISLKTDDGINVLEYANLTYPDNTASDPVIYPITNNTSKQYSDYQSLFDITDKVKNLSGGDTITITVNNTALTDYSFDGRIKLIALICAYDDSDNDKISYWLNIGQAWTKETLTTIFNTKDFDDDYDDVTLESIALSSADATYRLNGDLLLDPEQETGSYYIYDVWNITENFIPLTDTNLTYTSSKASTYASYKASVQLLKITTPEPYFIAGKITPPYSGTVFAGVNNTLTVTVTNGNIDFEGSAILLADGEEIAYENLSIDANDETVITFIDPTIRPIDETTVNGANNTEVLYTLNFVHKDFILNSTNATFKVLYNGNLGKNFAFPPSNTSTKRFFNITGDVIILTQDVSKYAGTGVTNVNYTFEVDSSDISDSLLYVAYNWDKIAGGDYIDWNITFNSQTIAPVSTYRDQCNLGTYGKYGYGLLVYDVVDLLAAGENVLVLNKAAGGCAVYPPTLLVLTENGESETYKLVYIAEEADLLSKQVNLETGSYTFMDDIETAGLLNSTLYVFAASAQAGEGNLIVNNNICEDIWNGTSSSLDYFTVDITDIIENENEIYFQATGSTIVALTDIIVCEKVLDYSISGDIKPPYAGTVFAGVNNTLTVTVTNGNKKFEGCVVLLADGEEIASSDLTIDASNSTTLTLIDPTFRPIDETTVNGANNTEVTYTLLIVDKYNNTLNSTNATFKVLYNGNLGKDFAYPASNATITREYLITGDVIILTQDVSKYAGTGVTNVNYTFEVNSSDIYTGLLYVAYNWDKIAGGDFNDWNITFNNQAITPIDTYRDQSNLGTYGKYGYGLLVYDVADLLDDGENVLVLNKAAGGCAVYPPTLLVLTENDESETYKLVYIAEEADLLSKQVNLETGSYTFMDDIENADLIDSTLYVFAASAQAGEGNLIVNNNTYENIWNGTSSSYDYYMIDMLNSTLENNVIYFEATGSTIVALQNILVVELERPIEISAPDVTKYYHGSERFVVTVTDYKGSPLANKTVEISINNVNYTRNTNENGSVSIALELGVGVYDVDVTADNQTVYSVVTILTTVNGTDITKVFRNDTQYFATFLDSEGNYLKDGADVKFNINGVMYDRKVSGDKGLAKLNINLQAGEYIITAINLATGEMTANNITVIPRIIENNDITKYYRNGTQYTVKIIGDNGNPVGAGENVTFNINGVLYTRQTDANGIAKLNINLNPGDYIITAEHKGSMVFNNIKVLPVLNATNISMKYRDGTQFIATVLDGQGKPYANQVVTFNINGVFYDRISDAFGQAKLNINLMPGEYIITSSYNGCSIANTVKISSA